MKIYPSGRREFTPEHCQKLSLAKRGKWKGRDNPQWRGGISEKNWVARRNGKGVIWRREVIRATGGKCSECGLEKGRRCPECGIAIPFFVHHKKSFAMHPELRYNVDNGVVLCFYCHKKHHNKER